MPPVYLDGIELKDYSKRLVISAMGSLTETCGRCGGSMLQVRSIFLHSGEAPTTFSTWCRTCGHYDRVHQFYPAVWHRRILKKVGLLEHSAGSE